ncbi:MAG: succinate dehydrogenase/fumarate reductase iron-sulfur subunit [Desulfobacteraceae bacterium]|nr:succinate dehydrogenase/fumarate reductase iron-sulfur subunit [Desulfobacteraceae bacterium]
MKIKIKIRRCEPKCETGCEPFLQAYDLQVDDGMTILEALLELSANQDPTIGFRRSCRSAICGSCAVMVNGFPKLACNTQVIDAFQKKDELILEPLSNNRVLKDLVVDFSPFWEKLGKVTPFLTIAESKNNQQSSTHLTANGQSSASSSYASTPVAITVTKEDEEIIDSVQKCIMCGACNAACNALEIDQNYTAPAALAKACRFVGDVREGSKKKRLERLSLDHGMWSCVRCFHCTEYCPKEVAPLQAIERLRSRAIKKGVLDNQGAKHTTALVESVKRVGRLDEAAMTFKTLGFLRSLGMIPFGLKMEMHGKMPHPIIFPAIEDIEEVRSIYKKREAEIESEEKDEKSGE